MSEPYTQALASLVRQQLAARGVALSDTDLLDWLLDPETLADHLGYDDARRSRATSRSRSGYSARMA